MARTAIVASVVVLLASCHSGTARMSGDADTDADAREADAPADASNEADVADDPGEDGPCRVPPPCPTGPPDGIIGRPCIMDTDCDDAGGAFCVTERYEEFEGEYYITNVGGMCSFWSETTRGCDPDEEGFCPEGSRCVRIESWDFSGCIDECAPADTSGALYGWACGCRRGYQCDINSRMCFSGCSNDRECCETWRDEDGDFLRDGSEVTRWEGCTSYCDGDDEEEMVDCMASYACINPGRPGALIGDPCEHDSHCPADGECMRYEDPDTGEEYFPGGYCTRRGCQHAGRGCEDAGGACLNTGTVREPQGICLRPCHVGREVSDPDYECRTTPGEEQVCFPVHRLGWIGGAPEGGEDGYCFPGNFTEGTGGIGEDCASDGSCASPLGLGECMTWLFDVPMCTVRCNETLVLENAICGEAPAGEIASTLCGWSMCWEGCLLPERPPGENGCSRPGFACAPLSHLGVTYVPEGALRPPGFCLPACDSDESCEEIYGTGARCTLPSGICTWS